MTNIQYGIVLPYKEPRATALLAREAEENGWDGVFVGDAIWTHDPMIMLAAAAMTTSRIRLGTEVLATPLRQPWQLASTSLALDHLSGGRLILGLGTGATWMGWQAFPDTVTETRTRAEMLDETIDILTLMYQRKQFDYDGSHYHLKLTALDLVYYPPVPLQQPRIPIWVPGIWPRMKNMRRVLKCDGIFPAKMNADGKFEDVTPEDVCKMRDYIFANRTLTTPFDIVAEGKTGSLSPAEIQETLRPWAAAGMTWWIESTWELSDDQLVARIRQGAPRLG